MLPLDQWWFWVIVLLASPFILVAVLGTLAIIGETLSQIAHAITGRKREDNQ